MRIIDRLFCWFGLHSWYGGCFQTGRMSSWTGDHVGVSGRVCRYCNLKQIRVKGGKYSTVPSFNYNVISRYER